MDSSAGGRTGRWTGQRVDRGVDSRPPEESREVKNKHKISEAQGHAEEAEQSVVLNDEKLDG